MLKKRFQSIMSFSHFGEEPTFKNDYASEIRFLLNRLNNRVTEIYTPHKELLLHESMMLWRGRLVLHQYIKIYNATMKESFLNCAQTMVWYWKLMFIPLLRQIKKCLFPSYQSGEIFFFDYLAGVYIKTKYFLLFFYWPINHNMSNLSATKQSLVLTLFLIQ